MESLAYTGGLDDDQMFGLPVTGPTLIGAGATFGGWVQARLWVPFAVATAVFLLFGIWGSTRERRRRDRRDAEREWLGALVSRGCRAPATVTEAVTTGERISVEGQTDTPEQFRFTVQFTDSTGMQHHVTKLAYFHLTGRPRTGLDATVLYSPDFLEPDKIVVALEPPHNVELRLRHAADQPPASWSLVIGDDTQLDLWASSVVVTRKLTTVDPDPGTQVVVVNQPRIAVPQARLDLVDGTWQVTNIDSTRSVAVTEAGKTSRLQPGESAPVGDPLFLGSIEMHLLPHSSLGHTQDAPELSPVCTSHDGRAWIL